MDSLLSTETAVIECATATVYNMLVLFVCVSVFCVLHVFHFSLNHFSFAFKLKLELLTIQYNNHSLIASGQLPTIFLARVSLWTIYIVIIWFVWCPNLHKATHWNNLFNDHKDYKETHILFEYREKMIKLLLLLWNHIKTLTVSPISHSSRTLEYCDLFLSLPARFAPAMLLV